MQRSHIVTSKDVFSIHATRHTPRTSSKFISNRSPETPHVLGIQVLFSRPMLSIKRHRVLSSKAEDDDDDDEDLAECMSSVM